MQTFYKHTEIFNTLDQRSSYGVYLTLSTEPQNLLEGPEQGNILTFYTYPPLKLSNVKNNRIPHRQYFSPSTNQRHTSLHGAQVASLGLPSLPCSIFLLREI